MDGMHGPAEDVDPALGPGDLLADRYTIDRPLGAGGMGRVYLAHEHGTGRPVAVKTLAPRLRSNAKITERFHREARSVSGVHHPNIVEILELGLLRDGSPFMVMEYLDGEDLERTIQRAAPMPWARARALTVQICRGLEAAHDAGVIHRDIKPANCFRVTRDGDPDTIKLVDFGLAKIEIDEDGAELTEMGAILGTAAYMSPEQARAQKLDPRADLYSVGAILFHLLTGRLPFEGRNTFSILNKHVNAPRPIASEVAPELGITAEQDALLVEVLAVDRDQRFGSAAALVRALEAIVDPEAPTPALGPEPTGPRASRRGPGLWVVVLVTVIAAVAIAVVAVAGNPLQ